ncbi:zinc finger protein 106 isoform X2 [Salmo trutta]|uniref:zinc finger protein 106 isoform X2 n=1 Tax=Salmo trutta TaxID=8032 RepID=UPI0011326B84|nr:zinc finger protein 106-like isoform X2 [Salmo trutta]
MTPTKKTPSVKVEVSCYCILCRKVYLKNDVHKHMQSMLHHRELENVKGRHWCKVCKVFSQGLTEYAEHISTQSHGDKIKNPPRKTKPTYVEQDLDAELLSKVRERNKQLNKMEKKKKRKKKKLNLKMEAQQDQEKRKCPKQTKGQALKWIPQVAKLKLAKSKTPKKMSKEKKPQQKTLSQPLSGKMVQNKENRLACELKCLPPSQPATPQGQSGAQPPWPEFRGPPGVTCHPYSEQHTQSTLSQPHQVGIDDNPPISVSPDVQSLGSSVRGRGFKASRPNTFHKSLRGAGLNPVTPPPGQLRWPKTSQLGYEFYGQAPSMPSPRKTQDMDFTSDNLPSKGAIIFSPGEGLPGSTTAPVSTSSSGPSGQGDSDKGRIRSVDVTVMLRQVRRALGVREPPRTSSVTPTLTTTRGHRRGAEVEAEEGLTRRTQRTKRGEAATLPSSTVSQFTSLPSTTTSLQSPQVSTTRSVASSETWPLPGNQAKRRSTRYPKVGENSNSQPTKEGASDTYGPGSSQTNPQECSTVPQLSTLPRPTSLKRDLTRRISKPGAHEPNLNAARRVRKGEKETGTGAGLKPTLKKLLSSAGSQRKVNWREMYQEANRKKQEKVKGMPRFGIELVNPLSDPEGPALDEDEDLPLTEGFQWESAFPDGAPPPAALPTPSLPQAMPASDVIRERPSEARTLGSEQSSTALWDSRSSRAPQSLCVKTEPEQYREAGVDSEQSQLNTKRKNKKRKVDSDLLDTSGVDQSGKKQKVKSNSENVQVDQLLAVSLMEEELSGSLQSLDTSLIQARNTLQVAYTEVQRLLLVKQQVTTEINGLRAKRIEILQGMQGAVAAATVPTQHPSLLPLSNLCIPSPTGPTSAAPLSPYPNMTPAYPSTSSAIPILNPTPSTSVSLPVKEEPVSLNSQSRATPSRSPVISYPLVNPPSTTPVLVPSPLPIPIPAKPPSTTVTHPATTPPAVVTFGLQRVVGSSTSVSTSTKQLRGRQKKQSKEKATRRTKSKREDVQDQSSTASSTTSDSEDWEDQEGLTLTSVHLTQGQKDPLLGQEKDGGKGSDEGDSDCYVETVTVERQPRSNMDVVAIDDSDAEEELEAIVPHTPAPAPLPSTPPAPPRSVCVEVNSSGTQTVTVKEDRKDVKLKDTSYGKMKLPPVTVKEKHSPPKCANVAEEQEPSLGSFEGHTGTVHDLQIHGGFLYTCSGDNTARAYCLVSKACQAVFEGHTNKINCLLVSSLPGLPARLYTGSSDLTIRCFSIKSKKCLEQISLSDRVLCLHIHWNILYVGLANGSVVSFEVKTQRQLDVFECHGPRGVSCLGTSQEGARRVLLVGSYDSTISVRDAKSGLLLRSLQGHTKTVLCMKVVNDLVFSGSSDTSVHAHNIHTGELVRIYKGHSHAVTALAILGKVMVTACLDKLVRVYELQSHDRLQVYGGHHDMVMCMAIHKSVIYTGCYDGTVQAVKLNLMQNYRCWWHGCSLIFGMGEHLLQHLLTDHSNPHLQTFKCRWRNCDAAFATQDPSQLDLPSHMQTHVEMDSKLKT